MDIDPTSYPDLKFFDRFGAIEKSQNRLPHWQQDSATCFLTFRLEDSLPNELHGQFRQERSAWLRVHPTPWSPTIHEQYHQLFSARIDRWLDEGHGSCLLADPALASFVSQTLSFRGGTEYLLHSWVVMPNHVHALMSPAQGQKMSKILAAWKRFSATKMRQCG